jgi:hypothetical protein
MLTDVDWNALAGMSADVGNITNALGTMNWNDITALAADVTTLTNELGGVDWTAIAGDMASVSGLTSMTQTVNALSGIDWSALGRIEQQVGASPGTSQGGSLIGRIELLSSQVSTLGGEASDASRNAQQAKTQIASVMGIVQSLKAAIGDADIAETTRAIRQVRTALTEAQESINLLAKSADAETIQGTVSTMAQTLEAFARSKGYEVLVNMQELPGAGEPGGAPDTEAIRTLDRNITEVRDSMSFMQKLMDEMRYEPVVEESLIAVE